MKGEKKVIQLKMNVAAKSAEESWKGTKVDKKVVQIAQGEEPDAQAKE